LSDRPIENDEQASVSPPAVGSRRSFFGLAATGVAGVLAGRLTGHEDAQAAALDPNPILADAQTTALGKTELATSGPITNDGAFVVSAPNADYGVKGSAGAIGVYGRGPIGVLGEGAVGGVFSGTDTALSLTPTGTKGPSTTQSLKGDVLVDKDGQMWFCIADGTPGTWIKLSHGGTRPLPAPVRVYASTDAINQGEHRVVPITSTNLGIPPEAVAIVGNLTVHPVRGGGFVTVYPTGATPPPTSNINWNETSDGAIANALTVGLGTGGSVTIFADAAVPPGAPATQVILDIAAYVL
jgi:hypothetical protein